MTMTTTQKTNPAVQKQKGYSLVEIGIVLAVIALLIGGVVTFGQGMFTDSEIKTEQQNIQNTSDSIKKLYEGTNYASLTNTVAQDAQVFPDRVVDNAYNHVWNGAITVAVANINAVANSGYAMTYAAVPSDVCTDLVTGVQGKFDVINVNGTDVKVFNGNLDRAATAANCNGAATVDIVFSGR